MHELAARWRTVSKIQFCLFSYIAMLTPFIDGAICDLG